MDMSERREGGKLISPRMFLVQEMNSITLSISAASEKVSSLSGIGKGAVMIEDSGSLGIGSICQTSSVRKGMKGWRSRMDPSRTWRRVHWHAALVPGPPFRAGLAISRYQSQNSCQKNR